MSMIQIMLTVAATLIVLALVIFPEARKKAGVLFRGAASAFVEDRAKTPEGANAIYTQAISEAEEQYQNTKEIFHRLSGRKKRIETEIADIKEKIRNAEIRVEGFARKGDRENAKLYADQMVQLKATLKSKEQALANLVPSVDRAKQAFEASAKKVTSLKAQKQDVISQMETNRMTKQLMDDLDDVYKNSATDKMLDAVREGAGILQEESSGAIAAHETKVSTRIAKAEKAAEDAESEAYLDEIMKKYSGGK